MLGRREQTPAEICRPLPTSELGARLAQSERAVVIWSSDGPAECLAALAGELGLAGRPGCGAFYLPRTPNGRGVTAAGAAADDDEPGDEEPLLVIAVGDEAAAAPPVRALVEQ